VKWCPVIPLSHSDGVSGTSVQSSISRFDTAVLLAIMRAVLLLPSPWEARMRQFRIVTFAAWTVTRPVISRFWITVPAVVTVWFPESNVNVPDAPVVDGPGS
jgi:hypothetical protein